MSGEPGRPRGRGPWLTGAVFLLWIGGIVGCAAAGWDLAVYVVGALGLVVTFGLVRGLSGPRRGG